MNVNFSTFILQLVQISKGDKVQVEKLVFKFNFLENEVS